MHSYYSQPLIAITPRPYEIKSWIFILHDKTPFVMHPFEHISINATPNPTATVPPLPPPPLPLPASAAAAAALRIRHTERCRWSAQWVTHESFDLLRGAPSECQNNPPHMDHPQIICKWSVSNPSSAPRRTIGSPPQETPIPVENQFRTFPHDKHMSMHTVVVYYWISDLQFSNPQLWVY